MFKIYAPEDTTGTDLSLPPDAKMLFMYGEGATLSLMIQSIMRMRQFLAVPVDPNNSQRIIWIGTRKLRDKIGNDLKITKDQINPIKCFEWGVLQEADRRKKAIVQRAFQEIQHVMRNQIMNKLRQKANDSQGQIDQFSEQNCEKAFKLDLGRDPYSMYALSSSLTDIHPVLRQYAEKFAKHAGLDLGKDKELNQQIETIIEKTRKQVDKVSAPVRGNFSASTQMEQVQEQEQDNRDEAKAKKTSRDVGDIGKKLTPIKPLDYASNEFSLMSSEIMKPSSEFHQTVNAIYKTTIFSDNLSIAKNAFEMAEQGTYYKPVEYFLVLEEGGVRRALVISQNDAVEYRDQIISDEGIRAALFTSDGGIVQKGKFTIEELSTLEKSEWFKEIVFEVGLLSCNIKDEERMKAKIKSTRAECMEFWDAFTDKFLDRDLIDDVYFEKLLRETPVETLNVPKIAKGVKEKIKPSPKIEPTPKSEQNIKVEPAKKPVKVETRGMFIRRSFREFFSKRKWAIPFAFLSLGIFPLVLLAVFAFRYKPPKNERK